MAGKHRKAGALPSGENCAWFANRVTTTMRAKGVMLVNAVGQRFGRLTVLAMTRIYEQGHTACQCRCDCGTVKVIVYNSLRIGLTRSCGCLRAEVASTLYRRVNQL